MDYNDSRPQSRKSREYYFAETIKEESSKHEDSNEESKNNLSSKMSLNFEDEVKSAESEETPFDHAIEILSPTEMRDQRSIKIHFPSYGNRSENDNLDDFDKLLSPKKLPRSSNIRISKMTQNIGEDPYFIEQVHNMLKLKYKYGFMKGAGVVLLTIIILMIL